MNVSEVGAEPGSVKATKPRSQSKPHFSSARYWTVALCSGGGEFISGRTPEAAARAIWRHNSRRRHNFDPGDITRNQQRAEAILSGQARWTRDADGDYHYYG